jgi:hypothetical protein
VANIEDAARLAQEHMLDVARRYATVHRETGDEE